MNAADSAHARSRARVTIGMPVLNGAPTIARAINSLLRQTFTDFLLVVSDNASTDETGDVLRQLAADQRLQVIRQSATLPMIENFSFLVHQAQSEYFMWAAADDEWQPTFLEELVRLLDDDQQCAVAMSSVSLVDPQGSERGTVMYRGSDAPDHLDRHTVYRRITKQHPGPSLHFFIYGLYRTSFLQQLLRQPFPRVMAGDRVLVSEVCLATRLRSVPAPLYRRTVTDSSLSERYPLDPTFANPAWRVPYLRELLTRAWRSRQVSLADKLLLVTPTVGRMAVKQRKLLLGELSRSRRR